MYKDKDKQRAANRTAAQRQRARKQEKAGIKPKPASQDALQSTNSVIPDTVIPSKRHTVIPARHTPIVIPDSHTLTPEEIDSLPVGVTHPGSGQTAWSNTKEYHDKIWRLLHCTVEQLQKIEQFIPCWKYKGEREQAGT